MAYKDNLLKKLAIERQVHTLGDGLAAVASGRRIDMAVLEQLMAHFPWTRRRERDLDFFLEADGPEKTRILVLDNDLAIYHTTVADMVLRKSPSLKEMLNIRNAIKILNDKDVVVSKKQASLETIEDICIGRLDLHFSAADIDELAREGVAALENRYLPGVQESLMLFADLLGLTPAPPAFALEHHDSYGQAGRTPGGETAFGPLVIFSRIHNSLAWLACTLGSQEPERLERLKAVAAGEAPAEAYGPAVFELMRSRVLDVAGQA